MKTEHWFLRLKSVASIVLLASFSSCSAGDQEPYVNTGISKNPAATTECPTATFSDLKILLDCGRKGFKWPGANEQMDCLDTCFKYMKYHIGHMQFANDSIFVSGNVQHNCSVTFLRSLGMHTRRPRYEEIRPDTASGSTIVSKVWIPLGMRLEGVVCDSIMAIWIADTRAISSEDGEF